MKPVVIIFCLLFSFSFRAQSLQGKAWTLQSINDHVNNMKQDIYPSFTVTLEFQSDSSYTGSACNNLVGIYKLGEQQSITFRKLGKTLMYCGEPLGKVEDKFSYYLLNAKKFALSENRLVIYTTDQHELVFER